MSAIPLTQGVDARDALYRKITWRLLPFLTLCYMLAYLDRINIGFAKLQMQNQLSFSDAAYGVAAGIFFIGYVLFEIPSNLLLPRIGARKTLSRIMVLWGLTSASMLFVRDIHTFYALRFLLGVFEAGFAPGMVLYLTYWYAPSRTARAMAVVMWAGPIGGVIGGPLSSWAMTTLAGTHGLEGWQWMFIVEGLPCCVLGVIAFFFLDDRPQQANWLSDEEKALLAADLDAQRLNRAASEARHQSLRTVVSDPRVLTLAFSNFCVIAGIYTVSFWLPTILKTAGVAGTMAIGLWSSLPYVAAIAAMGWLCRSSDRRNERRRHSAIASIVGAVALAIAGLYPDKLGVALPAIALSTAMLWASYTVLWALPAGYLGTAAAAGGIAFINICGALGGFASPIIIGVVKTLTGDMQAGMLTIVAIALAGAVAMLLNPIESRKSQAETPHG
ncbi:MFS transporter [Caballeronia sp. KNU42]